MSLTYGVTAGSVRADTVQLWFERDPGDTLFVVTAGELRSAAATGALETLSHHVRRPEPNDMHLLASPLSAFIGPQSPSDSVWAARMRLHQSWWRTFRLGVAFGVGPTRRSTRRYGNMLDEEGANRGLNFLSPESHAAYEERIALTPVGIDPWRTCRNLLASQPLAFNLFGHLSHHLDLATGLLRAIVDDDVEEVTNVEVERLSDALGDHTAFDAFATFRRSDGSNGCVAVETKLTEPFSRQAYDWSKYVAHPAFASGGFATVDTALLGDPRWSQLWRNHLLALAEADRYRELGEPHLLVVHHPLDPDCRANVSRYRQLLNDPTAIRTADLAVICAALAPLVESDHEHEAWAARLYDRYLDLGQSEGLRRIHDL